MSETTEGSGPEGIGTQENASQEEPKTTSVERGTAGNETPRSEPTPENRTETQERGVETRRSFATVTVSVSFKDGFEHGLAIVRSSGLDLPVLGPIRVTLADVGEKIRTLLLEYEQACKAAARTIRPPARRTTTVKRPAMTGGTIERGTAAPSATTAPVGTAGPSPAGKAQLTLL